MTNYGATQAGRGCRPVFVCKRKKNAVTGEACRCPSAKVCDTCLWNSDNAPREAVCVKCRGGAFLHGSECLADCPEGFTPDDGEGKTGRTCIPI